MDSG
jgi:isochorismate hydrolase